uniref:Hexosyltransferase n=1 Tax=Cacopsylla melanoneura TaxID=428564 RepID=A0A8D9ELI0_9HEMI
MVHERKLIVIAVGTFIFTCFLVNVFTTIPDSDAPAPPNEEVASLLSNSLSPGNFTWFSPFLLESLPPNDSSQLINITNFEFLINPPCSESPYIVVVHSAPGNYDKRHLIRSTWGSRVPLYFFFGETATNQTLLDTESAEYHDVVQGSFIDSYRNLTYKDMLVFKWVIYNCPRVRYVLKIDDDVFVNVARFSEFLTDALSPYGTRHLLMCYVWRHIAVDRSNNMSKFYVSVEEYPYEEYPPYCSGPTVLYSPDVLFKLYQSLQQDGNYFWIEDVFVTGIMVSKLNLKHAEFNWWKGNDLLKAERYEDLLYYDPRTNLFVVIGEANYKHNRKKLGEYFPYLTKRDTLAR